MSDIDETALVDQGAIPPTEFHDAIERLREIATFELEIPQDFDQRLAQAAAGLIVSDEVIRSAVAALQTGHVVIRGPPGTGKSSFIRALARGFNASIYGVTAHEDWTIYDVIGRLELRLTEDRREEIVPVNGALTEAVIRCGNNIVRHFDDPLLPQAEWLLIDELNRAHLDKAFGELFSVLGTDELVPINLPHQKPGNRELVIPRRFRIVATLNSYDRQFVQSLSQAIRRRFTFITLDLPAQRPQGIPWTFDPNHATAAMREFSAVIARSAERIARRRSAIDPEDFERNRTQLIRTIRTEELGRVAALFDATERVRYSPAGSQFPYLPIGTAQLIDTVELFLMRRLQEPHATIDPDAAMDWAAAVKLAPLFEADTLGAEQIVHFANSLGSPFDAQFKRELLVIAAAGMHFVPS